MAAVVIGVLLPSLWWLQRPSAPGPLVRALIVLLLIVKAAGSFALPQHGLCARLSTAAPFTGVVNTIPVDEPTGALRSYDLRADWRSASPRCTAIVDRAYASAAEFPAWSLNLLDAIRPGRPDLALAVDGFVAVDEAGTFAVQAGSGMTGTAAIDEGSRSTIDVPIPLDKGTHRLRLDVALSGPDWRLLPIWNGRNAWTANSIRFTVTPPRAGDRLAATVLSFATTAIVLALAVALFISAAASLRPGIALALWTAGALCGFAWLGASGYVQRLAGPLLFSAALVPVPPRLRNIRGTFLAAGVPWLAFFVARSLPQIGRVTVYTPGDDWLTFQAAAYRIVLNQHWIEGGSATFYFQPFYRWIAGALHLVFGDSSVGEVYWDAACIVVISLLAFQLVRRFAGFRGGMIAAAAVFTTFTLGTVWYFIGRGLAEISAAAWMSLAVFATLRARRGALPWAVAGGVFATLMFYTRLNHLLLGFALVAFLLPLRTGAAIGDLRRGLRHVRLRPAAAYLATFVIGLVLFAARTWWYTGVFGVLYGTSYPVQETGLRLSTIGSGATWARVGESVWATLWMNEPPHPDVRALLVVAGLAISVAALLQVPPVRRVPFAPALMSVVGVLGAFVAHAHHYPGRMSIHLLPFATATAICGAVTVFGVPRPSRAGVVAAQGGPAA